MRTSGDMANPIQNMITWYPVTIDWFPSAHGIWCIDIIIPNEWMNIYITFKQKNVLHANPNSFFYQIEQQQCFSYGLLGNVSYIMTTRPFWLAQFMHKNTLVTEFYVNVLLQTWKFMVTIMTSTDFKFLFCPWVCHDKIF